MQHTKAFVPLYLHTFFQCISSKLKSKVSFSAYNNAREWKIRCVWLHISHFEIVAKLDKTNSTSNKIPNNICQSLSLFLAFATKVVYLSAFTLFRLVCPRFACDSQQQRKRINKQSFYFSHTFIHSNFAVPFFSFSHCHFTVR